MSNIIRSTTKLAAHIIAAYISKSDVVVDATCGNGNDTLNLLRLSPAKLYAFDIQQDALDNTAKLLAEKGFEENLRNGTVRLICDSHANMSEYINEPVSAVIFNLGYLPKGSKEITTLTESTLSAVKSALLLLKKDGVVCISMYSGHSEGKNEKQQLLTFAQELDPRKYHCAYINMINQYNDPPEILLITAKK